MPKQYNELLRKSRAKKPVDSGGSPKKERHLPAAERAQELLEAAMELFAEKGLALTFQSLADRVRVTQPLVHRYFPTKAYLIGKIRETLLNAHWEPALREILTDRSRPLEERIVEFYEVYLPQIYRRTWYRSFWFFALDDPSFAQFYMKRLTEELFHAIIDEVRSVFGFPPIAVIPPSAREIELVWGMHSTPIFQGVRRYVDEMDLALDCVSNVRDHVRSYLISVPVLMKELMLAEDCPTEPAPDAPVKERRKPTSQPNQTKAPALRAS
jgi:AcrR family transcriptional regulator